MPVVQRSHLSLAFSAHLWSRSAPSDRITAASPMTRLIVAALCFAAFALNGCDNRTRDDDRWEQIAETLKKDKNAQPWPDAESPWANAEHHSGTAW